MIDNDRINRINQLTTYSKHVRLRPATSMHVKFVKQKQKTVALAVKKQALQNFRDFTVVFARFENTFEVRMLELGESNGDYVEVLGGLKPGTEYVTDNSFILKADILKNNASHDH